MSFSARFIFLAATIALVGGCATKRTAKPVASPAASVAGETPAPVAPAPSAPASEPSQHVVTPPAATSEPVTPSAQIVASTPTLPPGEYAVLIASAPDGAVVVVNNIPIGRAPQRVVLPGTPRGFFKDQVSVKVRFIAADASSTSQTIEEMLTPLDKIPSEVHFTPGGAVRVARK